MDPYDAKPGEEEERSDDLESGLPESVWTLDLDDLELEPPPLPPPPPPSPMYPDRPECPPCRYYIQTGRCGFGDTCRFHHPRNRSAVTRAPRTGSAEHPEHKSRHTCRYFVKNRNCHYGDACKFEHSKQDGYELPPWTRNYVPSASSLHQPCLAITSLESSNRPVLPSPYVQGPYGQLLVLPGLLQNVRWGTFQATAINPAAAAGMEGEPAFSTAFEFSPWPSSSATSQRGALRGIDSTARPSAGGCVLPERLDEPEFQNRDKAGFF